MAAPEPTNLIRDLVLPTKSVNPARLGRESFAYVDVSAVSRESLRIVGAERLPVNEAPSRARKLLKAGDVLFATVRPGLRRVALVPADLDGEIASTGFCVLRPDRLKVEPEYLYYACSVRRFVAGVAAHQKGSSYPAVTDGVVLEQRIPLPPLPEQRRIAHVLTTIQRAKEAVEVELAGTDGAQRVMYREIFERRQVRGSAPKLKDLLNSDGWTTSPLPDVLDYREGPGIMARDFRLTGVPLVRLAGLKRGSNLLANCNYLDPREVLRRWDHFRLREGDVLLSTSASLGEVATVPAEAAGAVPYTGIIRFRPADQRVSAAFIPFALRSPTFTKQVREMGVGVTIKHFGPAHLRRMTVDVPPREAQETVVRVLGGFERQRDALRGLSRAISALFEAAMTTLIGG